MSAIEEKLFTSREIDPESSCWRWTGCKTRGYGVISLSRKRWRVHRLAYTLWVGQIPDGLVIDHVLARGCIHKDCFNPDHLEAVTQAKNVQRGLSFAALNATKTHCKNGHQYTPANTINLKTGGRKCRTCKAQWQVHYKKRRAARVESLQAQLRDAEVLNRWLEDQVLYAESDLAAVRTDLSVARAALGPVEDGLRKQLGLLGDSKTDCAPGFQALADVVALRSSLGSS